MTEQPNKLIHGDLAYQVVGLAMQVHRELGYGFLEKVYENALMVLLQRAQISAQQQVPLKVVFEGVVVGDYYADILVDQAILIELKVSDRIVPAHRAQMLNYLKATGIKLGLIINFGKTSIEYERLVN